MAEVGISIRPTQLSVSSLQETALFFTAVGLCNNNELLTLILNCPFHQHLRERLEIKTGQAYKKVEAKFNELLSKIKAIGKFKAMIQDFLWPLAYRIIYWKYIYASCIDNKFLQCFHWTCQRRIDNKKTAKYIIENKMIPIGKRFMLACILCLKDELVEIWKDMHYIDKQYVLQIENKMIYLFCKFWMLQLSGNDAPRSMLGLISIAIEMKSIDATKYLFSLLPEDERGNAAEYCARYNLYCLETLPFLEDDLADIGYYVYSQMTKTYQRDFLNSNKTVVLLFLLYSPGQNEFFKILKDNINDFFEEDIQGLVFIIYYKMRLGTFKDYDYCKLFCRVWSILDESVKSLIIERKLLEHFFCSIISGYFRFLLTKSPSKSIKTSKSKNIIRHNLDKWNLIHFFIDHEIVTPESLKENKRGMLKLLRIKKSNKPAWRRLLKFVNDRRVNKN